MAEEDEHSLSALFDKYFKVYEDVEDSIKPTNSEEVQSQVKDGIDGLIKTTVLVSELSVFSSNENVEELPTSSLKFLLLPMLLGSLTLKRTDIQRSQALRVARVYFRDFVRRCRDYQITEVQLPAEEEEEEEEERKGRRRKAKPSPVKKGMPTPEELRVMARQREEKIRRLRERKALGERLAELKKALDKPTHDEDTLRTFHLTTIKKFVWQSVEEVESIVMEEKMLAEMERMRVDGSLPSPPPNIPPQAVTPLRPILLTRDRIQKNAFGLGYPSLPTMTVEEFYDQRVRDGWFPDPSKSRNCLQDIAALGTEAEKEAGEQEEKHREEEEERDDPEKLRRDRERDEWRDDHRIGWGNTYNRS